MLTWVSVVAYLLLSEWFFYEEMKGEEEQEEQVGEVLSMDLFVCSIKIEGNKNNK